VFLTNCQLGVTVARRSVAQRDGSTAAAMPTVMLDDPGSNPSVNHECMYLSRRTNVFCLVLSNYVVYRQLGKKPVDVSVYYFKIVKCLHFYAFKRA
jgi:hypothetical protein